jgi:hypothetical protein
MKKKEAYVAEHPEERRLVYRGKKKDEGGSSSKDDAPKPPAKSRNLFNKNGLPRHPERSMYYDPVMNPYGVPPPGMPYMERRKRTVRILRGIDLEFRQLFFPVKSTVTKKQEVTLLLEPFQLYLTDTFNRLGL